MTQPTAEQLELARECAVTAAHSARFDDEILSFWVTAWSDRAKGIFEEGATQSALLAIKATEARMAEAVVALEEIADMTKKKQLPLTNMVNDTAVSALAKIRSQSNG